MYHVEFRPLDCLVTAFNYLSMYTVQLTKYLLIYLFIIYFYQILKYVVCQVCIFYVIGFNLFCYT